MSNQRVERLQVMLTEDELVALDDWRFSHRMPSRASAIRELLKRGLVAEGFDASESGSRSKDYGVTASASRKLKKHAGNGAAAGANAKPPSPRGKNA